jgi:hypothetical protein
MAGYTSEELAKFDQVLVRIYDRSNYRSCLELRLKGPDKERINGFSVETMVSYALENYELSLESPSIHELISDTIKKEDDGLVYRINGNQVANSAAIPPGFFSRFFYAPPTAPFNDKKFLLESQTEEGKPMLVSNIRIGGLNEYVQ